MTQPPYQSYQIGGWCQTGESEKWTRWWDAGFRGTSTGGKGRPTPISGTSIKAASYISTQNKLIQQHSERADWTEMKFIERDQRYFLILSNKFNLSHQQIFFEMRRQTALCPILVSKSVPLRSGEYLWSSPLFGSGEWLFSLRINTKLYHTG